MINLGIRTEYNFKQTFCHMRDLHNFTNGQEYIGVGDFGNTFSHIKLESLCNKYKLKPIYGVRLEVIQDQLLKTRGKYGPKYLFIAKNNDGLQEINQLVKASYDNFYYKPMVPFSIFLDVSDNVITICDSPEFDDRLDYLALTPSTSKFFLQYDIPKVFVQDNAYPWAWDKEVYQLLAGARKHGDGYRYLFNDQTYPRHILTEEEFLRIWPGQQEAIDNTYAIAEQCEAELQRAPMVRYHTPTNLEDLCIDGAANLGIDLTTVYGERLEYELKLIKEKDFEDYFLIVSEMIYKAKKKMLVGPARGSAAGSLVCYLLGITTVDPIEHGLMFERFIDINRPDLPDIDIDFPDHLRQIVIKELIKTYGKENVYHISNLNRLKARSTLDEVGMALSIPKYKVEMLKESIVDNSASGRDSMAVADTLETTDAGKEFVEEYPKMSLAKKLEGHCTHVGKHAAGIIVCNEDLTNFAGVNSRENSIMMDKVDAEAKNLLKIDCLGLRTLSILQEAAELAGKKKDFYYDLPLNDKGAFSIFENNRFFGIFQFEGEAVKQLSKKMQIDCFDDIVSTTALARPGPLMSGAAGSFAKTKTGEKEIEFACDHPLYKKITEPTQGVIVYQEQLMQVCRECGQMSWQDVSAIRKGAAKSLGSDYFEKYREKFVSGCVDNEIERENALEIWDDLLGFGKYAFNKSHSVGYAYISYWCAYMKAHHPLEFTVASLNHSKNDASALRILRDAVTNDGLKYVPVDPDVSKTKWSVINGVMYGGLINIKGIAEKKAKDFVARRDSGAAMPDGLVKTLLFPETPFDILYPAQHYFGELYDNPKTYGLSKSPSYIEEIDTKAGEFTVIGKVILKELRDLNSYDELVKRGGKVMDEHNLFLRLIIEDDTGQIVAKINRFDYEKLSGKYYAENLEVDESWVIVKGEIKEGWRILNIKNIMDLKELEL